MAKVLVLEVKSEVELKVVEEPRKFIFFKVESTEHRQQGSTTAMRNDIVNCHVMLFEVRHCLVILFFERQLFDPPGFTDRSIILIDRVSSSQRKEREASDLVDLTAHQMNDAVAYNVDLSAVPFCDRVRVKKRMVFVVPVDEECCPRTRIPEFRYSVVQIEETFKLEHFVPFGTGLGITEPATAEVACNYEIIVLSKFFTVFIPKGVDLVDVGKTVRVAGDVYLVRIILYIHFELDYTEGSLIAWSGVNPQRTYLPP